MSAVAPEPELPEAVRFGAEQETTTAGPAGTPKITIALTVEIGGEWVKPELIADAARQLARSMVVRLGQSADEIGGPT